MALHEGSLETRTHGRYLVETVASGRPLLVGFHGYAESAEIQLERLRTMTSDWNLLSIQGLHRFYRNSFQDIVASWMTRQDRDLVIADNKRYVTTVIDTVVKEISAGSVRVYTGFSQGVAMAFRAASVSSTSVGAVIALGSDIPPDVDTAKLSRIRAVLLGRGERDEWYTAEKLAGDRRRLQHAGVEVDVVVFDAAHEWTSEFSKAASRFLQTVSP